jgi:outer membrane protein OmpA-like peptidoglycan-associated protein
MRKQFFFFNFLFLLISPTLFSQELSGISSGNYAGITGVSLQPASIVDSRYKFDINLISTDVNFSNNYFLVNRNFILKFNKNNFNNYKEFKNNYLSQGTLATGEKMFFDINTRTQLPLSFMVTTGKKSAIALNMQLRTIVQGRGISAGLAELAFNDFFFPPRNNTSIDASGINLKSLSWAEVGLTYGRVLYSSDKHFLKAAVTGKYLAGLSSIIIASNDLRMRVNNDSTFNFSSSNVTYNHNKNADFNNLFSNNLNLDANSFGLDAGLVYEFRGNPDRFKYIRNDDEKSYEADRRDLNKYTFKVGVSLLDVGMFQFNKPDGVNSFSANINNWDIKNGRYTTIQQFDTALAARVVANPNDPRTYNMYLPTALSAQVDVRFVKGLFLNVMSYWPVNLGSTVGQRFTNYGFYTITPRYERRHFGVYFPYTISQRNNLTNYNQHLLGATLRVGPLYLGSSNLGTMIFNNNLHAADVHLGLKIGIAYGKPNKASKFVNKIFAKKQDRRKVDENDEIKVEPGTKNIFVSKVDSVVVEPNAQSRLSMNYKDGNIYTNPKDNRNIIIVNNYYYGNSGLPVKSETNMIQDPSSQYNPVILDSQTLSVARQKNKIIADSTSKIIRDSLTLKKQQLDSLIKAMQQLQRQMDTTSYSTEPAAPVLQTSATNNIKDSTGKIAKVDNQAPPGTIDTLMEKTTTHSVDQTEKQSTGTNKQNVITQEDTTIKKNSAESPSPIKKKVNKQDARVIENSENVRRTQEQQDELYRQYALQSAGLADDINRLNSRLTSNNDYYRTNINYVPVPVPNNSYSADNDQRDRQRHTSQLPVTVTSTVTRDTVYIRDTVAHAKPAGITKVYFIQSDNTPKKVTEKAAPADGFDYASLPPEIILFATGKYEVQPIYYDRLEFIAKTLNEKSNLRVTVTGHTDATGSKQINEKLSLMRAKAVVDYFENKGISAGQLIINSVAAEKPAVAGNTKVDRSQNRRVVVRLVDK